MHFDNYAKVCALTIMRSKVCALNKYDNGELCLCKGGSARRDRQRWPFAE